VHVSDLCSTFDRMKAIPRAIRPTVTSSDLAVILLLMSRHQLVIH
jgi:hypothetical protein